MGNKSSARPNPLKPSKVKLLTVDPKKLKIAKDNKLDLIKQKCRKLKNEKIISSNTKMDLIREALPGLNILYEPLKTFYSLDKILMNHNFGAISLAYSKQDLDTQVMVKIINMEKVHSHLFLAIQNIVQVTKLDHPNIPKIRHVLFDDDKLYLVMDFDNYICLGDYVLDNEKLSEETTIKIIKQLLDVVSYLNSVNI